MYIFTNSTRVKLQRSCHHTAAVACVK